MQMGMMLGCELYQEVLTEPEKEGDERTGDRSSSLQPADRVHPVPDAGEIGPNDPPQGLTK